ncbi:BrnA antitoxin family protein [Methylobacterium sp.]|uniref:BrnA antitoxin family protein n=1 Tax=Methylobacterium sp. TaxID=409 RepID=UPI003C7931D7
MTRQHRTTPASDYGPEDWAAVDSPEATEEQLAQARPFAEAFPDLAEAIKRTRGRPRKADARVAVTLRLDPETLQRFQALGPEWRTRMGEVLRDADVK